MANEEWNRLVQAALAVGDGNAGAGVNTLPHAPLFGDGAAEPDGRTAILQSRPSVAPGLQGEGVPAAEQRSGEARSDPGASELGRLTYQIEQLRLANSAQQGAVIENTRTMDRRSENSADSGDRSALSIASTVFKVLGTGTGISSLVSGISSLFGGNSKEAVPPALTPFSMPSSVNVEAGLGPEQQFTSVAYGQGGLARPVRESRPAAPIQINVNAMDSRSFLDHRDEIASAVREAMLQSHSLNDVVQEL